jgi:hypothetical protein
MTTTTIAINRLRERHHNPPREMSTMPHIPRPLSWKLLPEDVAPCTTSKVVDRAGLGHTTTLPWRPPTPLRKGALDPTEEAAIAAHCTTLRRPKSPPHTVVFPPMRALPDTSFHDPDPTTSVRDPSPKPVRTPPTAWCRASFP